MEWTVSELSAALRRTVEDAYGYVRVRGEVSGFKGASPSGHCYFRLKDDKAVLEAVIWKTTFGRMRVKPEEGLDVVVSGKLTTFAGSSKYQIVVDTLEPAGIGALMKLLEERKKKLAAEGLFDAARKQLLPFLPETIGVVTSPTGAVIRDILHRLQDRFPRRVIVWPVRVQGDSSAAEVASAIRGFNALPERGAIPRPDLIIVARGGGSLEDLWSFNEEIVVRAAAESMIPLISAVGHETDVTLIDFASDKRAPTPTAAAEMAVPVRAELIAEVLSKARRALACWQRGQEYRRTELRAAARALPALDEILAAPRQRLDACAARLPRALLANAHTHHRQFALAAARLSPRLLRQRIARGKEITEALGDRRVRCYRVYLERRTQRLRGAGQLLQAFSYRKVLERGFTLVRDGGGTPLRSATSVSGGVRLEIEFSDGRIGAVADGDASAAAAPVPLKPKRRGGGESSGGQGNLFGA
ncbi:MAG TPA: exodeoxyribonuclease VII large subunit [Pseudolabrys sp.]|nr:exodeoxyribonuclease VII large subunit [Pseudolabrys sp.]